MEPASPRMTAQTREALCDRILIAAAPATGQTVDVTTPGADFMRIAILGSTPRCATAIRVSPESARIVARETHGPANLPEPAGA